MSLKIPNIDAVKEVYEQRRDFLKVTGEDSIRFLQGMWTSDINLLASEPFSHVRSLLLGLKAKPVCIATILHNNGEFWISVPEGRLDSLFEALDRYLVADDVELEKIPAGSQKAFRVFSMWSEEGPSLKEVRLSPRVEKDPARVFKAVELESGYFLRIARMGDEEAEFWMKPKAKELGAELMRPEDYLAKRIEFNRPEWGVDFDENSLILEFPFDKEISFHKGCYIGQEVVARGSYRGQVAKSFASFRFVEDLKGAGYIFSTDNEEKPCGKLTTFLGNHGLGQLRTRDFENKSYYLREGESPDALGEKRIKVEQVQLHKLNIPE